MDDRIRRALSRGHLIDITTIGRRTGRARRIEVVFHNFGGRVYISGMPGRRGWYANLVADPNFTFHLKGPVKADLPATARAITDPDERNRVFADIVKVWRNQNIETMARRSPLVEVTIEEPATQPAAAANVNSAVAGNATATAAGNTTPAAADIPRERGAREAGG